MLHVIVMTLIAAVVILIDSVVGIVVVMVTNQITLGVLAAASNVVVLVVLVALMEEPHSLVHPSLPAALHMVAHLHMTLPTDEVVLIVDPLVQVNAVILIHQGVDTVVVMVETMVHHQAEVTVTAINSRVKDVALKRVMLLTHL